MRAHKGLLLVSVVVGLVLSAAIAALAFSRGSLSRGGALGAILVGTLVFSCGGLAWGVLLVAFFVTSSRLSHFRARAKEALADKFQKGHRRDFGQVLANGGWGALLAFGFFLAPNPVWFSAFVGAMATVNADTWATELGVLSKAYPHLITTGRRVPIGTSGGITLLGTLVSLGGALLIGSLAAMAGLLHPSVPSIFPPLPNPLVLVPVAAISGLLGSLFDSLLGATVQAMYFCDYDRKVTESQVHRCGNSTRLIRGWRWLDNDWVNLISSVLGSGIAAALYPAMAWR